MDFTVFPLDKKNVCVWWLQIVTSVDTLFPGV